MPDQRRPSANGWSVFRTRLAQDVPRTARRRAAAIGAASGAAALVALVVLSTVLPWPGLGSAAGWLGTALLAAAVGTFAAACTPLSRRATDGSRRFSRGSVLQAPEQVERHLRRGAAPTISPRDRDAVLRETVSLMTGLVQDVFRALVIASAALLAVVGAGFLGTALGGAGVATLIALARAAVSIGRLGRVERAHDLARSLPPAEVAPPPGRPRPGDRKPRPTGTKLALPDE